MSIPVVSLFIAFLVNLFLAFLVFIKRENSTFPKINVIFSILAWAASGWAFSFFMVYMISDPFLKLFFGKTGFASSAIIPVAFLLFSIFFPDNKRKVTQYTLLLITLPTIFFLGFSYSDKIVSSLGTGKKMFNYGSLYPIFSIYLVSYILLGFSFLINTYKYTTGLSKLQIKYCLIGMFITASLGLLNNLFLPMFGYSVLNWLGPTCSIIMVGFTTYSIVKHRLMDINIVLKKGTTYVILLVLLFVPSFILTLICQKLFFGNIDYLFSFILFLLLFCVAFLFHRIKPGAEKTVEQFLFKDKYDYRETLADFSKAMVSILDLNSLSKRIIGTITQTMGVEKASIFILNEEKGGFELLDSKNVMIDRLGHILSKNDPLPHYLQKIGEIVICEELAKGVNISELEKVVNQMIVLEAQVSIPLVFKEQLIGIINLGYKFNKEIYSHEDIELLTTLANQAAIAIENAKLYEDLKKSKSYIRRADRLASLGTLTAGLAHEIRNPLVAIKTFTQLLPERLEDEEFREKFLHIASGEVDRIALLINELLDFARPSDPKFEPEDINNILDGMILLISTEAKKKNIKITKNLDPNLPLINIDREQMKQVFLNILINAIEATPDNGEIMVKSRSFTKPNGEQYIQIEFKDTGHGIPKEYLEEIFNPFFTTKTTGSGLGLSISNQIVQEHKGYIHVESEIDKGSSFFVNLPLNQEHPKRRKTDFEDKSIPKDFDFFERR